MPLCCISHSLTMSFLQIRSHAQKYFLKVQKSGTVAHVPPPRPKRKASHPYPQKASKNGLILFNTMMFCSLKSLNAHSWHDVFMVWQFCCHCQLPWLMFLPLVPFHLGMSHGMKIPCSWILDPTNQCLVRMSSPIFLEMKARTLLLVLIFVGSIACLIWRVCDGCTKWNFSTT